ncbi:MAG: 2Fe-2S iron-sulfur cluster binding domain-containing protein [Deltaproteobacteria bacterium]|nr:2Fe-2S iron-sulfur cluster binding domain-containing protein [Deltaproteobacteria bacterium]
MEWDDRFESLLELAEKNGVEIESIRRQGVCGSCQTRLISGRVEMEMKDGLHGPDRERNMIPPCVSIPKMDISLEV